MARSHEKHRALMERALRVVPGGVFGHGAAAAVRREFGAE